MVLGMMAVVMAAAFACGPSAAELKAARMARYQGNAAELFDVIERTTAEDYKIGDTKRADENDASFALMTVPQWYNPEGGRESEGADGFVSLVDRSVQLAIIVQLAAAESGGYVVTVTPKTFQHISGSPKPRELAPDDPNLPGWVQGRVEELHLRIHKALRKYAVQ
jgi:hypothetical protein